MPCNRVTIESSAARIRPSAAPDKIACGDDTTGEVGGGGGGGGVSSIVMMLAYAGGGDSDGGDSDGDLAVYGYGVLSESERL